MVWGLRMNLDEIFVEVKRKLDDYYEKREDFYRKTRDILIKVRKIMVFMHQKRVDEAMREITNLRELIKGLNVVFKEEPRLRYSNLWIDTAKEVAEAILFYEIMVQLIEGKGEIKISSPYDLGVPEESWILGLAEVTGELRRQAMLALKDGNIHLAFKIKDFIGKIYENLSMMPYPSSIIPNIKGKVDYVRSILVGLEEKIIEISIQSELDEKIKKLLFKFS